MSYCNFCSQDVPKKCNTENQVQRCTKKSELLDSADPVRTGYACDYCPNMVKNPCKHQSQVKWCKQKPFSKSEVYGHYITELNGILVEQGIGPVSIEPGYLIEDGEIIITNGNSVTRVKLESCS